MGEEKRYQTNSYVKNEFNHVMSKLITNNSNYFFEKIIGLNHNDFRNVVQKTHIAAILHYLDDLSEEEVENNELLKQFIIKLVDTVGIDNINTDDLYYPTSYYKYIKILNEEALKKIDIERVFNKTSHVEEYIEDYLIDKLLETDNWLYRCKKMNSIGILKEIIFDNKVKNYVLENFSDKDILEYLVFLEDNSYHYKDSLGEDFLNNLVDKVYEKDNKNKIYLKKILENDDIIKFLGFFTDNFSNLEDLSTNKNLRFIFNLPNSLIATINDFLVLVKDTKNLNFELNLEDINEDFLRFVKNVFFVYEKEKNYGKTKEYCNNYKGIGHKHIITKLFDTKVDNYNEFLIDSPRKVNVKTAMLYTDYPRSEFKENLKILCNKLNIPYNISGFEEIENGYNDYLNTTEENKVYLYNFLNKDDISYNMEFFMGFFKRFHDEDLDINKLLDLLEITKNKDLDLSLLENLELLDKHGILKVKDFITKGSDNRLYIQEMPKGFYEIFDNEVENFELVLKIFDFGNIEKVIGFYKNYNDIFVYRKHYGESNSNFDKCIGDYVNLEDEENIKNSF